MAGLAAGITHKGEAKEAAGIAHKTEAVAAAEMTQTAKEQTAGNTKKAETTAAAGIVRNTEAEVVVRAPTNTSVDGEPMRDKIAEGGLKSKTATPYDDNNLRIIHVLGDGNCLFRSIAVLTEDDLQVLVCCTLRILIVSMLVCREGATWPAYPSQAVVHRNCVEIKGSVGSFHGNN